MRVVFLFTFWYVSWTQLRPAVVVTLSASLSLSPLPLSPCEEDDGLHFLFLRLQLHPAAAQDATHV